MKKIMLLITAGSFLTVSAQTGTDQGGSNADTKFVQTVAQGGQLEVMLGHLAQTKAQNAVVKLHAQHMIDDHSKANEELKTLAARKNISLSSGLHDKKQEEYNKLNELNGKDFDKKYTRKMIRAHKKNICLFKKEAKRGKDADVKAWAAGKVETLKGHLAMWKEACKAIKKS